MVVGAKEGIGKAEGIEHLTGVEGIAEALVDESVGQRAGIGIELEGILRAEFVNEVFRPVDYGLALSLDGRVEAGSERIDKLMGGGIGGFGLLRAGLGFVCGWRGGGQAGADEGRLVRLRGLHVERIRAGITIIVIVAVLVVVIAIAASIGGARGIGGQG